MTEFDKIFRLISVPNSDKPWGEMLFLKEDVPKFIEFANNINNISRLNNHNGLLFRGQSDRGQSNSIRTLKPKLYRLLEGMNLEKALAYEFNSIDYFKKYSRVFLSPNLTPNINEIGAWLGIMQQYGSPTRMLDWTTSFNVALYFAVYDEPCDANSDGALWFFDVQRLLKYMSRYENPPEEETKNIFSEIDKFIDYGINKASPKTEIYDLEYKVERIVAQGGMFTFSHKLFSDHADDIGRALLEHRIQDSNTLPLTKLIFKPEIKKDIRKYLSTLGINARALFPGVEGVGKSVGEILRVEREVFNL